MAGDRGTPDIVQFNVPDLEGLTAVERAFWSAFVYSINPAMSVL